MKQKFKIISSNSNQKEGFVTKLYSETKQTTVFGDKMKRETYYVSGTKQMEKDSEIELDLNNWRIQTYPFVTTDEQTGEIVTMNLNWLHLK